MSYKALITDLDDTLYIGLEPCNAAGVTRVCEVFSTWSGLDRQDIRAAYQSARECVKSRLNPSPLARSRTLYMQEMVETVTGRTHPGLITRLHDAYWAAYYAEMKTVPEALLMLQAAKQLGKKTGIVTNMIAYIQHQKLAHLGLDDFIDLMVTSEEAGVEKPDPTIFKLALTKLGCASSECVYVGDDPVTDLAGAQQAGIRAILITQRSDYQRVIDILAGKD